MTYRLSDHTTADDASRYRNDAEVSEQWQQEPILRLRTYLVGQGWWTTADEESLLRDCSEQIDHAVATYLGIGPQEPTSMFDSLYAELPPALLAQRDEVSVLHRGVVDD
ncbi:unannotated protein [freshwater metagenome]|uniref:Unannotated protein n=1 Tax=freshwater metagenome TaxID=449393 RepID=A0A6J7EKK8_9ZZZZ